MSYETFPGDKTAGDDDPEVEKTVTVEGYVPEGASYHSWREFADDLAPDTNWHEKTTTTTTTKYLVIGGERVELGRSDADAITEAIAANPDVGVRVDVEKTTERDYKHPRYRAGWRARDRLLDAMPSKLAGLHRDGSQYQRPNGETVCSISASVDESKVLAHHEVRTDDNRYETTDQRWSVTITFTLGPAPKAEVDEWSNSIVGPVSTTLGRFDCIEKVRAASCTEERQGDCFL